MSIPDGFELPVQPDEIKASVKTITLTDTLRTLIRKHSPQCTAIDTEVRRRIAEVYTTCDEMKLLRLGPSAEFTAYNTYVENCRQWGSTQKSALGL